MLLFAIPLVTPHLSAQVTTGAVTGTIRDNTGAVVVKAQVTLTDDGTVQSARTESTATRTYVFSVVNPGAYTLHVAMQGFKEETTPGVQVHIQETVKLDYTLTVGAPTEEVTVAYETPLMET